MNVWGFLPNACTQLYFSVLHFKVASGKRQVANWQTYRHEGANLSSFCAQLKDEVLGEVSTAQHRI